MRFCFLLLAFTCPFSLTGGAIGGSWGLGAGALLALTLLWVLWSRAENGFLAAFPGLVPASPALQQSFARTFEEMPRGSDRPVPALYEYVDPAPNAFWARRPGGAGTIVLSRGLVNLLSEDELRTVLEDLAERVQSPRASVRTLAAVLGMGWLRALPSDWARLLLVGVPPVGGRHGGLSAGRLLAFAAGYPVVRFLAWVAGNSPAAGRASAIRDGAMRKLEQGVRSLPFELSPALSLLGLVPAGSLSRAVPFGSACA